MKKKFEIQDRPIPEESVKKETITAAMAQKALEDDRKERIEKAKKMIDGICQMHKVRLSSVVVIQDGQISSQVLILAE